MISRQFVRFQNSLEISGRCEKTLDSQEEFPIFLKISGETGRFCGSLEDFWTVWKISGQSGKFLDSVKYFWTVWITFWTVLKIFGQFRRFLDSLEDFRTACKIYGQSGEFLDQMKYFCIEQKVSRQYGRFQTGWKISKHLGRFPNSLGFMLLQQMNPEHNTIQTVFTGKMCIDWNGPVVSRAYHILSASLNSWFGTKGR